MIYGWIKNNGKRMHFSVQCVCVCVCVCVVVGGCQPRCRQLCVKERYSRAVTKGGGIKGTVPGAQTGNDNYKR